MKVTVLYFARLRETVGRDREEIALPESVATVADLRAWLAARGGGWGEGFAPERRVRAALDQDVVPDGAPLRDGAEVAFFPPVTGG